MSGGKKLQVSFSYKNCLTTANKGSLASMKGLVGSSHSFTHFYLNAALKVVYKKSLGMTAGIDLGQEWKNWPEQSWCHAAHTLFLSLTLDLNMILQCGSFESPSWGSNENGNKLKTLTIKSKCWAVKCKIKVKCWPNPMLHGIAVPKLLPL